MGGLFVTLDPGILRFAFVQIKLKFDFLFRLLRSQGRTESGAAALTNRKHRILGIHNSKTAFRHITCPQRNTPGHLAASFVDNSCGSDPYSGLIDVLRFTLVPLELNSNFPFRLCGLVQMGLEHGIAGIADANSGRASLHHTKVSLFHAGGFPP